MSLAAGERLLSELEQVQPPLDAATVLEPLNRLLLVISNVEGENYLLSRVHPDPDTRRTAEDQVRQAQQLRTRLMQNGRVFAALRQIDEASLDPLARRALAPHTQRHAPPRSGAQR